MPAHDVDVLVVGGGSAALCAAIAARRCGASVLLVEWAPLRSRGGNTRHARNFRMAHEHPTAFVPGSYTERAFFDDILRVTRGNTNRKLARILVGSSMDIADWLIDNGVHLEPRHRLARRPSARTAFLLGGGKAMINALYATAIRLGVRISYDSQLIDLDLHNRDHCHAVVVRQGKLAQIASKVAVACAGGNQADISWLGEALGDAADGLLVRGTSYASGLVLRRLLECGMQPVGDRGRCHLVAVDARAPKFDSGIVTRATAIPYGIVVNRDCVRFADEGEDVGNTRFSKWGALVCGCPDQIAYLIMDAQGYAQALPSVFSPIAADDIECLAGKLQLDAGTLEKTVQRFNAAAVGSEAMAPIERATIGLRPPKSRHAVPLTRPPFVCYPLRPGLTSTYFGLAVAPDSRVLQADGSASRRLFAAGSIMAANILREGYLAGLGITISVVFGRLAGQAAALEALNSSRNPQISCWRSPTRP